jgi:hypothetical protein
MKSHRRLWWVVGAMFIFSVAVGYLARPEDELAGLTRFHPRIEIQEWDPGINSTTMSYSLTAPLGQVLAALPGTKNRSDLVDNINNDAYDVVFPSGRKARAEGPRHGLWSRVLIFDRHLPWYSAAWLNIEHRLGFK